MKEVFLVYIDRLQGGKEETISFSAPAVSLDLDTQFAQFEKPLTVDGKAYLAKDFLVLHMSVSIQAKLRCKICNTPVDFPIEKSDIRVQHALTPGMSTYNFRDDLRDEIIIATPQYAECRPEGCPHRKEMEGYIKKVGA